MFYLCRVGLKNEEGAFTLIEATCALIISSLIVIISISLVTTSMRQVGKMNLESAITWHFVLRELESVNHRFELMEVRDKLVIVTVSQTTDQKYELRENHALYLTCQE